MATILIVDDLSANREFLVTLLKVQGHRLLEATDGSDGLAAVHADHPDLVITDVLMPVMDGYEFVRQLRLDPTISATPVVLYTAYYGEREARALAGSLGVSDILTKPVASAEVLKIVNRVLAGEPAKQGPAIVSPPPASDSQHLRLLTHELSDKAADLRTANARLRGLINIGLELASERDPERLLQSVCGAARDLFGATYVTLGIVDLDDQTVQRVVTCGEDAANWIKPGDPVSGLLGTVVVERRLMRGHNPGGDPVTLELPSLHPSVQAFLAAPVASPSHVYGWFCLVGNEGRTFTEDDEHLVLALSGQIGRIYESTHFHAIALKRTEELEHEILEREQAESALRLERDRAQRYLDTADVILLALDMDGLITLINRKGCDLLGWTERELLGCDFIKTCLPARLRVALREKFHTVVGGNLSVVEAPILTRSGEERLIEWHNTLRRDDAGEVIGTLSSGTDITERSQAAAALQIAEERMRFALEAANVGVWDVDCATGVGRWSDTQGAHYGLPPGVCSGDGKVFIERIHPDDREVVLETFRKAVRSGADFSFESRSIWPDGTVRWLSSAGRYQLGADGQAVRGIGITLDATEHHILQDQYQQAQKMEAIGRLAGGVAHDFNNLLTAILGYCELLLADVDPGDPRHADISEIQKAGMRAAGLTRQLLAFSRKEIIQPTVLDLNVVVADMRSMLGRLIREDVTVVLTLQPELASIKADRGQVEQIVLNLVVNAQDAMPKGGTLTIETANVELDEHYAKTHLAVTPGPYVVFRLSDTGTGMTPEVQTHLFEPFFTTKEPGKGTGLGLATVHGIVTRSGGSVTVDSEVGKGTSFKVYFPRADAADAIVEASPPIARPQGRTQTILVVDDEDGLRELVRRQLERRGYTVLLAAGADDALRVFEQHASIDVLLTDVVMPGASGPELTRQLLARQPGLKVIYMSGYTEDAIAHHGILRPGIAFLNKPITAEALGRKVREVLGQEVLA